MKIRTCRSGYLIDILEVARVFSLVEAPSLLDQYREWLSAGWLRVMRK
jgi:hypothetical protein